MEKTQKWATWLVTTSLAVALMILMVGCDKDPAIVTPPVPPTEVPPTVKTIEVKNLDLTTVIATGEVSGTKISSRGIYWSTTPNPASTDNKVEFAGTGANQFSVFVSPLTVGTKYYVRAYATNPAGTGLGEILSFNKERGPLVKPVVVVKPTTDITKTSATVVAKVVPNEDGTTVSATVTNASGSRSVTLKNIDGSPKTFSGKDTVSIAFAFIDLNANSDYSVTVIANNAAGNSDPATGKFKTAAVMDVDGNYYGVVTIGTQVWMTSNLKTTHYRDGSAIPNVADNAAWSKLTTGGMCFSGSSVLYNWYAATDNRGLAPAGWHVATAAEFVTLKNFLGGFNVAGGKLKETGTAHWKAPNTGATNETGFGAIPNPVRLKTDGSFIYTGGEFATWLSIDTNFPGSVVYLSYDDATMEVSYVYSKEFGAAVVCVQD